MSRDDHIKALRWLLSEAVRLRDSGREWGSSRLHIMEKDIAEIRRAIRREGVEP